MNDVNDVKDEITISNSDDLNRWLCDVLPSEYKQFLTEDKDVGEDAFYKLYENDEMSRCGLDIENVYFENVDIQFPFFVRVTNLEHCYFDNCNFDTLDVDSLEWISNVEFCGCVFKGLHMDVSCISGFDLIFENTYFERCNFSNHMEFYRLSCKNVTFDSFFGLNHTLTDAKFESCLFNNCTCGGYSFELSDGYDGVEYIDCRFKSCDFSWAKGQSAGRYRYLPSLKFFNCNMPNIKFMYSLFSPYVHFEKCNVSKSDFSKCMKVMFEGCNVQSCDLTGTFVISKGFESFRKENRGTFKSDEFSLGVYSGLPEEGEFIGFKIAKDLDDHRCLVKLKITADAYRIKSGMDGRCRCSEAEVLGFETMDGKPLDIDCAKSIANDFFKYEKGKIVSSFGENKKRRLSNKAFYESGLGIYFFLTRFECQQYNEYGSW